MVSPLRIALLLFVGGCGAFAIPVNPQSSTPLRPVWNVSEIRGHLESLNGGTARGRTDGSLGYDVAAQYVARLIGEFGLQPVQGRDFRTQHPVSRNVITAASLRLAGIDSVAFVGGRDFLPDPRSSPAHGLYGEIVLAPRDVREGDAVVLSAGASTTDIVAAREAGAGLVVIERLPRPAYASRPITGVGIIQASPTTVSRIIMGAARSGVDSERLRLRRPLRAEILVEFDPLATGVNVVGYIPGKHPVLARDAVLLCTHLDALGSFAGVEFVDLRNFGVEVAALLEVARQFAAFSSVTRIPERTLIVAFLSGGSMQSEGLSALLSQPVWDHSRIYSMYYLGEPANGRQEVIDLASAVGLRPNFVMSRDTIPDVVVRRDEALRTTSGRQARPHTTRNYMPTAVAAAEDLSRRVHSLAGSDLMNTPVTSRSAVDR